MARKRWLHGIILSMVLAGCAQPTMVQKNVVVQPAPLEQPALGQQAAALAPQPQAEAQQPVAATQPPIQAQQPTQGQQAAVATRPDAQAQVQTQVQPQAQPQAATQAGTNPEAEAKNMAAKPFRADLPDFGAAPELTNSTWLNSDKALRLADLKGQVVLVDFWTFECINCIHVVPSLRTWHQQFSDKGLTIVGVHTPEFDAERNLDNVKNALKQMDIRYPVAIDNDYITWRAYDNHYWPAYYLLDKQGHIRYKHIGEGGDEEVTAAIQSLLKEG